MTEDRPVVVAVDGGAHSARTLRWGLAQAELLGADVQLIRAWQEPRELAPWGWTPTLDDWHLDRAAAGHLEEEQRRASVEHPARVVTARLLRGPEVPMLLAAAQDARLLVVGASARPEGGRLGPVAGHLATHAPCAVAVVRGGPDDEPPTGPVVVGVDGSDASVAAARTAAWEAVARGVALHVVHARPTVADPYGGWAAAPQIPAEQDDPTSRAADALADELRGEHPGLRVEVAVVDDGPAHALVERSRTAALVVVGCRGLGAFRGMLLGSVSHEVLRRATSTVLVARGATV